MLCLFIIPVPVPEDKQDVQRNRVGNHRVRGASSSLWGKLGIDLYGGGENSHFCLGAEFL